MFKLEIVNLELYRILNSIKLNLIGTLKNDGSNIEEAFGVEFDKFLKTILKKDDVVPDQIKLLLESLMFSYVGFLSSLELCSMQFKAEYMQDLIEKALKEKENVSTTRN